MILNKTDIYMISYKKQRYDEIRTKVDDEVLVDLLRKTLAANGLKTDDSVARRVLLSYFASVSFYLYANPQLYIDFAKMVLYRDSKLENLLVLESKNNESARSIIDYYKNGGAFTEELTKLVDKFIRGVLKDSTKKEQELAKQINKLNKVKRSKESSNSK